MTFCPSCGFNLTADEPFEAGDWLLGRDFVAHTSGKVSFSGHRAYVLYSVARAHPKPIRRGVIGIRLNEDGEDPQNYASIHVHRIRSELAKAGIPDPIKTVMPSGYLWNAPGRNS